MTLFIKPACTHSWFHHWLHYNSGSCSWLRSWLLAPRGTVTKNLKTQHLLVGACDPQKRKGPLLMMEWLWWSRVMSIHSDHRPTFYRQFLPTGTAEGRTLLFDDLLNVTLTRFPRPGQNVLSYSVVRDGCYCSRDPSYPIPDIIVIIKPDGMGIN